MFTSRSPSHITTHHDNGVVCVTKVPATEMNDLEKGQLLIAIGKTICFSSASYADACISALYYMDRFKWLVEAGMPEQRAQIIARTRVSTFLGLRP